MATTNVPTLNERARANIRILKGLRRVSDQQIADAAGFTSRQMVAARIGGDDSRTPLTLDQFGAIAEVLSIEPTLLLKTTDELMLWVAQNPEWLSTPTPARKPTTGRKHSGRRTKQAGGK